MGIRWVIANCVGDKGLNSEHRVNKAMLAICQRCIGQMNLEPKQELAWPKHGEDPLENRTNGVSIEQHHEQAGKKLADNFAKLILTARENKGWTQAQLGQRMAETVNVIKSAESGKPLQILSSKSLR